MDTPNKIDTLDEALRVIFLESVKDTETAGMEMQFLLSSPVSVNMSNEKIITITNIAVQIIIFGLAIYELMKH